MTDYSVNIKELLGNEKPSSAPEICHVVHMFGINWYRIPPYFEILGKRWGLNQAQIEKICDHSIKSKAVLGSF